jgi:hypothetical protein
MNSAFQPNRGHRIEFSQYFQATEKTQPDLVLDHACCSVGTDCPGSLEEMLLEAVDDTSKEIFEIKNSLRRGPGVSVLIRVSDPSDLEFDFLQELQQKTKAQVLNIELKPKCDAGTGNGARPLEISSGKVAFKKVNLLIDVGPVFDEEQHSALLAFFARIKGKVSIKFRKCPEDYPQKLAWGLRGVAGRSSTLRFGGLSIGAPKLKYGSSLDAEIEIR